MMTSSAELEKQIEKLVREHMAACRKAAMAAVERAFTAGACTEPAQPQRHDNKAKAARKPQPRRSAEELEALGEQLYDAVCAMPGETMMVLAAKLAVLPRQLQIPAERLKRAGRVRTVGQRQYTRYFPMAKQESGPSLVSVGEAAANG